jgi:homocysteine S-methyltransferase
MGIQNAIHDHSFVLIEAAVIESLRRSGDVDLHPRLANAPLIYDERGRNALSGIYQDYIRIARKADIPIIISTPTWRANHERLAASRVEEDVNGDAVRFLRDLRSAWGGWAKNIFIGGLIGCKNDCYNPAEGLSREDAEAFHQWQIDRLAEARVDVLMAVTLPAVEEATGMALAMTRMAVPYIISFVINREGNILDGNSLEKAFCDIDAACSRPPLGYMINCAHPSFLRPHEQPESVLSRLIGYQANASSLDHSELDGADVLQAGEVSDWGSLMIELNEKYGVKILGGCCGTGCEHLEYIVRNIHGVM